MKKATVLLVMFILSLSMTGCIKQKEKAISTGRNVDVRLEKYLTVFNQEAAIYHQSYNSSLLIMVFDSSLSNSIGGDCSQVEGKPYLGMKIRINPMIFLSPYDIPNREEVIFHELGHCLMNRNHVDSTLKTSDGYRISSSIMESEFSNSSNYENNRTAYLHELFTGEVVPENYSLLRDHSLPSEFPYDLYRSMGEN